MGNSVGDLASPTVATQASPRAAARLGHSVGVNYREEAWRPALIAFYAADCMPTKAAILKLNAPLDYLDLRTIEALKAALAVAP